MNLLKQIQVLFALLLFPLLGFAQAVGTIDNGKIAYYSDKYQGAATKTGEPYDKNAYTAAHKTFAMGTLAKFTNPNTGQAVVVRINDKKGATSPYIADLSRIAAEAIGFSKKGQPGWIDGTAEIVAPGTPLGPVTNAVASTPIDYNQPAAAPATLPANTASPTVAANPTAAPAPQAAPIASAAPTPQSMMGTFLVGKPRLLTGSQQPALPENGQLAFVYHSFFPKNSVVLLTNINTNQEALALVAGTPTELGLPTDESMITMGNNLASQIGLQANSNLRAEVIGLDGNVPVNRLTSLVRSNPSAATVGAAPISQTDYSKLFASINTYTAKGEAVKPAGFGVQVGSYNQLDVAIEKAKKYESMQFKQVVIQTGWTKGEKVYRVMIGEFANKDAANDLIGLLKGMGEQPFAREHYK